MKITQILAASDFSEGSDAGVRAAHAWATQFNAKLCVCHVLPTPMPTAAMYPELLTGIVADIPELIAKAEAALRQQVRTLTGRSDDLFTVSVAEGTAHVGLLEQADAVQADLVVIGSLGHSRAGQLLLGSVAEQVVRGAHVPVLVARPSPSSGKFLAAIDLAETSPTVVDAAIELAQQFDRNLTVLHALHLNEPLARLGLLAGGPVPVIRPQDLKALHLLAADRLKALLRGTPPPDLRIEDGPAAGEILRVAKEEQTELIVVGNIERKALTRLLLGSVSAKVVRSAPCSVFVHKTVARR